MDLYFEDDSVSHYKNLRLQLFIGRQYQYGYIVSGYIFSKIKKFDSFMTLNY